MRMNSHLQGEIARRSAWRADHRLHFAERCCGQRTQFFIAAVLNRMGDEQAVGVKTPGLALRLGRAAKYFRGDEAARHTATVEFPYVLQTARRTRASVGQAFDHHIAIGRDLL